MLTLLTSLLVKICLWTASFEPVQVSSNYDIMNNDSLKIESLYKEILALSSNRMTTSMSSKLDTLIALTENDQERIGLFIWAVGRKVETFDRLGENGFEESYSYIDSFLSNKEGVQRVLLHGLLAKYLSTYYAAYSYLINEREDVSSTGDMEVDIWSSRQFFEQIVFHIDQSIYLGLQVEYPLSRLSVVIQQDSDPDWVNSLTEFLLLQAIQILSNRDYWVFLNEAIDPLLVEGWARGFEYFKNISLPQTDSSPAFKILGYYQLLLKRLDPNSVAFVYFELERLDFISRLMQSRDLTKAIDATLNQYNNDLKGHPGYLLIVIRQVDKMISSGNQFNYLDSDQQSNKLELHKAVQLIDMYLNEMSDNYGVDMLAQRKASILKKVWNVQLEATQIPGRMVPCLITYRNIGQVYIHIYEMDPSQEEANLYNSEQIKEYFSKKQVYRSVKVELLKDTLFHERLVEFLLDPLPVGRYVIFASSNEKIDWNQHRGFQRINVSDIQLVVRQKETKDVDVWAVDMRSGQPLEGVNVEYWTVDYNRTRYSQKQSQKKTNNLGMVTFEVSGEYSFRANHNGSSVSTNAFYSGNRYPTRLEEDRYLVMTDRAIYRPGQILYFKGIIYGQDKHNIPNRLIKGRQHRIQLLDVNYREVGNISVQSNEWGGFDGSLVIPESVLPGYFTIQVDNLHNKGILVENYKRPTFEVVIKEPGQNVLPGVELIIAGKAGTYSGSPIVNARVRFRVETYSWRGYDYYGSRGPWGQQASEVVLSGETITDEEGNFQFKFTPPDKGDGNKRFFFSGYKVTAEVLSSTGETRNGEKVIDLHNQPFVINANIPEKVIASDWNHISLSLLQANGKSLAGTARVSIIPLTSPAIVTGNRNWSQPTHWLYSKKEWHDKIQDHPYSNENAFENWKQQSPVLNQLINLENNENRLPIPSQSWPSGVYRVVLEAADNSGTTDTLIQFVRLLNPNTKNHNGFNSYLEVFTTAKELVPGQKLGVYLSSPQKHCTYITVEKESGIDREGWKSVQKLDFFEVSVNERDRGGFSIHYFSKLGNKIAFNHFRLNVPFDNKDLKIEWLTERRSLYPGQEDRWGFKVTDSQGKPIRANLTTVLYDASLDVFASQNWTKFNYFQLSSTHRYVPQQGLGLAFLSWSEQTSMTYKSWTPPSWNLSLFWHNGYLSSVRSNISGGHVMKEALASPESERSDTVDAAATPPSINDSSNDPRDEGAAIDTPLSVRENLEETAFFFSNLVTDKNGEVFFDFKMKEALTRWNLLVMAYDQSLSSSILKHSVETKKDLMVFPNVPRFLRQDDVVYLKMTVRSQSEEDQIATVRLKMEDALTGEDLNKWIHTDVTSTHPLRKGGQIDVEWGISVPDDYSGLVKVTYQAIGGNQSDGEIHYLPVLSNKIFIVETIPFTILAGQQRILQLEKIKSQVESKEISDSKLSLQITENPAWYAVMALPDLASGNFLTDQLAGRYFAASLSNEVINRNPKIKDVFKSWKSSEALLSELEKNESMKLTVLRETPWVQHAASESQQRQRIALYFQANQIASQLKSTVQLLSELQNFDGGFPWYKGGASNVHSTRQFLMTMGYLDLLRVKDVRDDATIREMILKAIPYLDKELVLYYNKHIKKGQSKIIYESFSLAEMVNYLYTRSMYKDIPLSFEISKIQEDILDQLETKWIELPDGIKPMAAQLLYRNLRQKGAKKIMDYFSENLIRNEDIGYYLRSQAGYNWYQNPVVLHLHIMDAMAEIGHDPLTYQWMKLWLLNNKRGNSWSTINVSAKAIFILFRDTENWLSEVAAVAIKINDKPLVVSDKEAGSGRFNLELPHSILATSSPHIQVINEQKSVPIWGSLTHQYFTDQSKVEASDRQLPLQISKEYLLIREGQAAIPLDLTRLPSMKIGDKIKVKMVVRVDRPLEFLHLKDQRPVGTEPWLSESGHRWGSGFGFYQSITDTGADYFFQALPTGSHVFEFDLVVSHKGKFTVGPAQIQSFYAPEFSAHSNGGKIVIGE